MNERTSSSRFKRIQNYIKNVLVIVYIAMGRDRHVIKAADVLQKKDLDVAYMIQNERQ